MEGPCTEDEWPPQPGKEQCGNGPNLQHDRPDGQSSDNLRMFLQKSEEGRPQRSSWHARMRQVVAQRLAIHPCEATVPHLGHSGGEQRMHQEEQHQLSCIA
ncbi:MAG: hypothetical protein ACK55I_44235 [bacterium]